MKKPFCGPSGVLVIDGNGGVVCKTYSQVLSLAKKVKRKECKFVSVCDAGKYYKWSAY